MCSDCGTGIFNLSLTQSPNGQLLKCSRPARWASWPLIVYLTHHRISIGDQISKHSFVWMSSAIWANYGSPICHLQDVSPILNVSASRSTNFGQIAGGSLLVASRESQTVSLPVFPIIHGRFGARKFLCRCCSRTYPLGRPFSSGIPNAFSHLFNALLLSWMALFLQQSWGRLVFKSGSGNVSRFGGASMSSGILSLLTPFCLSIPDAKTGRIVGPDSIVLGSLFRIRLPIELDTHLAGRWPSKNCQSD